jgi:hypothetical protein
MPTTSRKSFSGKNWKTTLQERKPPMRQPAPIDPRGRPEPYRTPDRAEWEARNGVEPFIAKPANQKIAERLALDAETARRYIQRDWSTMSAEESFRHRANLDLLLDEVAAQLGTDSLVYFDPDDGQFWIYPTPNVDKSEAG